MPGSSESDEASTVARVSTMGASALRVGTARSGDVDGGGCVSMKNGVVESYGESCVSGLIWS